MMDFWNENDIILQPVVAYNAGSRWRCYWLLKATQPSRARVHQRAYPFWPCATVDFTCKKNTLRAKRDEHGELSIANDRIQPAFAGLNKTVAIPIGPRVTGYLPQEHPLVRNGSFGGRFVEGIYLCADHDTPCVCMYCITSEAFRAKSTCKR